MLKQAESAGGLNTAGAALDAGRGLAIVAVIYGHALAPWFMHAGPYFSEAAYMQWKFGASFMMPFFFFISGLAWRVDKSLWATLRESITLVLIALGASLTYDVLLFALTKGGLEDYFAQAPTYGRMVVSDFARSLVLGDHYALSALWFLAVLAIVRVMAAVCERTGWWSAVALAGVLFTGYLILIDSYFPNFYQARLLWVGFAAFMIGRWSRGGFDDFRRNVTLAISVTLAAGALTAATFNLNRGCPFDYNASCGLAFLDGRFGVSMYASLYGYLPLFVITAAFGAIMATGLAILLVRSGGAVGVLVRRMGRNSLNLLIVNAVFLELANPIIARDLVPYAGEATPLFFAALLAATIVANLLAARLLRPALTLLRTRARAVAVWMVALVRRAISLVSKRPVAGASFPV